MKTKNNISNLKKMVVTIASAMILTTGIFASSTPANTEEMASSSRLAELMNATEQSIRFVAPAVEESQDVFYAMTELNTLAESVEASVKYVAPSAEEETVAPEMESLNALAESIEADIKYVAPAVEETEEVAIAIEGLDRLAADTESAVAFKAPRAADSMENETNENQMTNLMLAVETK
jgi:uridine phosphorylase